MTWIVPWNGTDYDVDPSEFTGLELSLVKQRTGMSFTDLMRGAIGLDGDAIRALFWVVDRRQDQSLAFSDYAGPSIRTVMPHIAGLGEVADELGKALPDAKPGSAGSPSSSDSPETTSAD